MTLDLLYTTLVQELGFNLSRQNEYLAGNWEIEKDRFVQLLFYVDEETGIIYISTQFEHRDLSEEQLMLLLQANLIKNFVKFCLDKDGDIVILSELPTNASSDQLKRATYSVVKAASAIIKELDKR